MGRPDAPRRQTGPAADRGRGQRPSHGAPGLVRGGLRQARPHGRGGVRAEGIGVRDAPRCGCSSRRRRARPEAQRYEDRFLSATEFQWQSQNRNTQQSELGQKIRRHQERGVPVHLFVRRQAKVGGTTQPFLYAGTLEFQRWEGERPTTVWWRMAEPVPEGLWGELRVGEGRLWPIRPRETWKCPPGRRRIPGAR